MGFDILRKTLIENTVPVSEISSMLGFKQNNSKFVKTSEIEVEKNPFR